MNKETKLFSMVGNLVIIIKGYFMAGPQHGPLIRLRKCPTCGQAFLFESPPVLDSRLLTLIKHYGTVYDTVNAHLKLEHGQRLDIKRTNYIFDRVKNCLVKKYGRETM